MRRGREARHPLFAIQFICHRHQFHPGHQRVNDDYSAAVRD